MDIGRSGRNAGLWFLLAGGCLLAVMLLVVSLTVGLVVAVKGSYVLLGVLLAAAAYYSRVPTSAVPGSRIRSRIDRWRASRGFPDGLRTELYGRVVLVLCLSGLAIVHATGTRLAVLAVVLPVGYGLVAYQIAGGVAPRRTLPQVVALFAVSSVTRHLAYAFYYGSGDVLLHVRYIEELVATGTAAGIPRYSAFPGLHTLAGAVSSASGLPAYDALALVGFVAYAVLLVLLYALATLLFGDEQIGVLVALSASFLEPLVYYSGYVFPQSYAVVLGVFVFHLAFRARVTSDRHRNAAVVLSVAFSAALSVTHDLTVVLFVPIAVLLVAFPEVADRLRALGPSAPGTISPRVVPIWFGIALSMLYWTVEVGFIRTLVFSADRILTYDLFAGGSQPTIYTLGTSVEQPTVTSALASLGGIEGIHFIFLAALISIAIASVLDAPSRYWRALGPLSVGVLGSLLVLRTPFQLSGVTRLALPMSVFLAMVVSVALVELLRRRRTPAVGRVIFVVCVVVLGTTGPLVAGDDLYAVHDGEELSERTLLPEPQAAYDHDEYAQIRTTVEYAEAESMNVSSFWTTTWTVRRFGYNSSDLAVSGDSLRTDAPFLLYRLGWTDHLVFLLQDFGLDQAPVVISDRWLASTLAEESKVYTNGRVGLIWAPGGGDRVAFDAPNGTATDRAQRTPPDGRQGDTETLPSGANTTAS